MSSIILTGKIVYDPIRIGPSNGKVMRKTHKSRTMIADLPRDGLAEYYRSLISKRFHIHLQGPVWGAHLTIVSGDEYRVIKRPQLWLKHSNKRVDITIDPTKIYQAWQFWVIPVIDDGSFKAMRDELGLTKPFNFHITVAREYLPEDYPAPRPEHIIHPTKLSVGG